MQLNYSNQLRVGRYDIEPYTIEFTNILIHTRNKGFDTLSPFNLLWNDCIIENVWQGSKIYKSIDT